MTSVLRIGTRGSSLALWQAHFVAERLAPAAQVEIVEIATTGDQALDMPLTVIGGLGVFTKEIQNALLERRIDIAVHSLKDLPTTPVAGLTLAAVPERGPVEDVFISRRHRSLAQTPAGAVIATGSQRRQAQLRYYRPDFRMASIRGNVETRLRKLEDESLDGLILARAGLERLGLENTITEVIDPEWLLPAVGQGALGVECRSDDEQSLEALRSLDHAPSRQAVTAERSLLAALGAGCQMPVGARTIIRDADLILQAVVLDPDGTRRLAAEGTDQCDNADKLGCAVAQVLLNQGAEACLQIPSRNVEH